VARFIDDFTGHLFALGDRRGDEGSRSTIRSRRGGVDPSLVELEPFTWTSRTRAARGASIADRRIPLAEASAELRVR
jgi:hypothetical protein